MPIFNCFTKKMLILIDLEINLKPIGFLFENCPLERGFFYVAQGKARVKAQAYARIIQALFLVLLIYGQV